jgi:hypothetical protein
MLIFCKEFLCNFIDMPWTQIFLLYHSERYNTSRSVFYWCYYINYNMQWYAGSPQLGSVSGRGHGTDLHLWLLDMGTSHKLKYVKCIAPLAIIMQLTS